MSADLAERDLIDKLLQEADDANFDGNSDSEEINVDNIVAEYNIGDDDVESDDGSSHRTGTPDVEQILQEYDTRGVSSDDIFSLAAPQKNKDYFLIEDPLSREETRMKDEATLGNHERVEPLTKKLNSVQYKESQHQSFVKFEALNKVENEIMRLGTQNVGMPTVCRAHTKFLVYGTSRGVLVLFNHNQDLLAIFPLPPQDEGEVVSVDVHHTGSKIVAGYHSGAVIVWDIHKKIHRIMKDGHVNPVVFVEFYGLQSDVQVISCDNSGLVNLWRIYKQLWSWTHERRCLLTNQNAGQIYDLAVIPPHLQHPIQRFCLVALVNANFTLIVSLEPAQLLTKFPHEVQAPNVDSGKPHPCRTLCWRPNNKDPGKPDPDPVVAVCVGQKVQLLEIHTPKSMTHPSQIEPRVINGFDFAEVVDKKVKPWAMSWVDEEVLAVLAVHDGMYKVYVLSRLPLTLLEVISKPSIDFLSHKFFHHESCRSHTMIHGYINHVPYVYLLGRTKLEAGKMMSWEDRIGNLKKEGKWLLALCTAMKFYETLRSGAVSNRGNKQTQMHMYHISQLLVEYEDIALALRPSSSSEVDLVMLAGVALDYCSSIGNYNLLFSQLYPKFKAFRNDGKDIFLRLLEPYILTRKLSYLPVPVMQDLFDYYRTSKSDARIQIMEQCILRLNVEKMDMIQVTKLCHKYALFTALCHVYTTKHDYQRPLIQMVEILQQKKDVIVLPDQHSSITYRMLLYMQEILNGNNFSSGERFYHEKMAHVAKSQVISSLFHDSELRLIKFFLKCDAEQFFNIMTKIFDDEGLYEDNSSSKRQSLAEVKRTIRRAKPSYTQRMMGAFKDRSPSSHQAPAPVEPELPKRMHNLPDPVTIPTRQVMVNRFLGLLSEYDADNSHWESWFYVFCSSYLARDIVHVEMIILEKILTNLLTKVQNDFQGNLLTDEKREERLVILLDRYLSTGKITIISRLLMSAKANEFHRVQLKLLKHQDDHEQVIQVYLRSKKKFAMEVFDYIDDILSKDKEHLSDSDRSRFRQKILTCLPQLIDLNVDQTGALVVKWFSDEHNEIMQRLADQPKLQYHYLRGILMKSHGLSDYNNDNVSVVKMFETSALHDKIAENKTTFETFVKLSCLYAPKKEVKRYLKLNETKHYEIKQILEHVEQANILDAVGYLKERMGDTRGALQYYLKDFQQSYDALVPYFRKMHKHIPDLPEDQLLVGDKLEETTGVFFKASELIDVREKLNQAMELCETHSKHARGIRDEDQEKEVEDLWFEVLKVCLQCQNKFTRDENSLQNARESLRKADFKISTMVRKVTNELFRTCLETMKSYVSSRRLLEELVQGGSQQKGKTAMESIGQGIDEILAIYRYEELIRDSTNNLFRNDITKKISDFRAASNAGLCLQLTRSQFKDFFLTNYGEISKSRERVDSVPQGGKASRKHVYTYVSKKKPSGVIHLTPPAKKTSGSKPRGDATRRLEQFNFRQKKEQRRRQGEKMNLKPSGYDIVDDERGVASDRVPSDLKDSFRVETIINIEL